MTKLFLIFLTMPFDAWEQSERDSITLLGRDKRNRLFYLQTIVEDSYEDLTEATSKREQLAAEGNQMSDDEYNTWHHNLRQAQRRESHLERRAFENVIERDKAYDKMDLTRDALRSFSESIWARRLSTQRQWPLELQQRLESLIYVSGSAPTTATTVPVLPPPQAAQEGGSSSSSGQ